MDAVYDGRGPPHARRCAGSRAARRRRGAVVAASGRRTRVPVLAALGASPAGHENSAVCRKEPDRSFRL
jgi:hypothetical protein